MAKYILEAFFLTTFPSTQKKCPKFYTITPLKYRRFQEKYKKYMLAVILLHIEIYIYILGWRKNNSYFYFPSLISNCVPYSIKKIFAKGTAKQKIFRGRSEALKIYILFKMMNFFCIKPSLIQLFFILRLLMKTRAKD